MLGVLGGAAWSHRGAAWSRRGVAWSRRRNGLETQEEWLGVAGGAAWSHKRSPPEIKEELPGVANFVPACFPPF